MMTPRPATSGFTSQGTSEVALAMIVDGEGGKSALYKRGDKERDALGNSH